MSRRKQKIKNTHCPNCDYTFKEIENFCPNCGQDNHSHKLPLKHYIIEFLESTIHFDTKFFQTFKLLLFKPGQLTKDYNDNVRAKYVPPIRLYIFISFVFFGLVTLMPSYNSGYKIDGKEIKRGDDHIFINIPTFKNVDLLKIAKLELTKERIDSIIIVSNHEPNWLNRFLYKKYIEDNVKHQLTVNELNHKIWSVIPVVMFLFMPFFALLLMLFNYRKNMFYVEHLNFSLHFHSLVFIMFICYKFISIILPESITISPFIILGVLIYLFMSLKSVYLLSAWQTFVKTFFLSIMYGFIVIIFLAITILGSLI